MCLVKWPVVALTEKSRSFKCEHGYFRSISSGRDFQFFSAHFFSESRTDTRVGAFDRYTLPTYGKIIENICNIKEKFFRYTKVGIFQKRGCHGNCSVGYTPMNLRQAKAADLKVEADIHCLATSGSRAQLMDRLAKHYASVSHVNRKKWTTNECNMALKVGRKSKKKSKKFEKHSRKRKRGSR